jgi:polyisoprenoid-binding protein YceI
MGLGMMKQLARFALPLAIMALLPAAAPVAAQARAEATAGKYKVDTRHASLIGAVSHLGLADFTFRIQRFDGTLDIDPAKPESTRLDVTIDPASVATGVPALDTELAGERFFNVAKFPQARFVSTSATRAGANRATVTGQLTLLGATRPVTLDVTFNGAATQGKDQKIGFSAKGSFKRSDFGMTALVGPVGDVVKIAVEAEFIRQP